MKFKEAFDKINNAIHDIVRGMEPPDGIKKQQIATLRGWDKIPDHYIYYYGDNKISVVFSDGEERLLTTEEILSEEWKIIAYTGGCDEE